MSTVVLPETTWYFGQEAIASKIRPTPWNFVGRSQEEIETARTDWMTCSRFGEVKGYDGPALPTPELPPVALKPRGRMR